MFQRKPKIVNLKLNAASIRLLDDMQEQSTNSEEYSVMLAHLERVNALYESKDRVRKVDPNTMALIAGNLFGILIIVAYEQKHVLTSKGIGFIKPLSR